MADWVDASVELQECMLSAQQQSRKPEGPAATGACLFCDEPLPEHMRWCNGDCRADWEREQAAKRRAGA